MEYLTTNELSERWQIKPQTLRKWRIMKKGPQFVHIRGNIRYRIRDIEAYELKNITVEV